MNYLYNGIELPDINEAWTDKETYPYATIVYGDATEVGLTPDDKVARLEITTKAWKYNDEKGLYIKTPVTYAVYMWTNSQDVVDLYVSVGVNAELNKWFHESTASPSAGGNEVRDEFTWVSHDILNENGTIYLEASEPPVPVQDENVFIKISTLKAISESIKNKTGKTDKIPVLDFASEIDSIETGSSGGADDTLVPGMLRTKFTTNIANGELTFPQSVTDYFREQMELVGDVEYALMCSITIQDVAVQMSDVTSYGACIISAGYSPAYEMEINITAANPVCDCYTSNSSIDGEINHVRGAYIDSSWKSDLTGLVLSGNWFWLSSNGKYNTWKNPIDFSVNIYDTECIIDYILITEL